MNLSWRVEIVEFELEQEKKSMEQKELLDREQYRRVLDNAEDQHEFFMRCMGETSARIRIGEIMQTAIYEVQDFVIQNRDLTRDDILKYLENWLKHSNEGRGD